MMAGRKRLKNKWNETLNTTFEKSQSMLSFNWDRNKEGDAAFKMPPHTEFVREYSKDFPYITSELKQRKRQNHPTLTTTNRRNSRENASINERTCTRATKLFANDVRRGFAHCPNAARLRSGVAANKFGKVALDQRVRYVPSGAWSPNGPRTGIVVARQWWKKGTKVERQFVFVTDPERYKQVCVVLVPIEVVWAHDKTTHLIMPP